MARRCSGGAAAGETGAPTRTAAAPTDASGAGGAEPPFRGGGRSDRGELLRALAALAERPGPGHARIVAAVGLDGGPDPVVHTDVFTFQLHPYASVYTGNEGMMGGAARDRVAGFWRALGLRPPSEPDHLCTILAFQAALGDGAEAAASVRDAVADRWRHARRAFFWEHLGSWVFAYLDRLVSLAPPFYGGWAALLRDVLAAEAAVLGPPDELPLHLREAAPLPEPDACGLDEIVDALLAPVRSGALLIRADLARAGRDLGVVARVGERRFALRHLLRQHPGPVLQWLAAELRTQAGAHGQDRWPAPAIAESWAGRARRAAALAAELDAAFHR